MTDTLSADAALAASLVVEAGGLAHRMRAGDLGVTPKTSGSDIVTVADHAAERHIVERLGRERPLDGVLGEEGAVHAGTSGRTWVIDPVDGTYNFARGSDWWCSAVALVETGPAGEERLLLGAVHHPASGHTYVGGPGLPSTRDGRPMPPIREVAAERRCAATYLHPPFYDGAVGDAFARAVGEVGTLRMLGSGTMDAVAIARGQADVVFQHSVADWDRLPGAALLRGLGGESRVVGAAGVDWHVAGAPGAVADVCAALLAG